MPPYIVARSRSVLIVVLAMTAACRRDETPRPSPAERRAVGRGDRVVVEAKAASFFEGRVLSATKEELRVEVPAGEPLVVSRADVYRLPPEAEAPAEGRLAICRLPSGWDACRVRERRAGRVGVESTAGERASLPVESVLAPSPLTELNLKQRFERAAERAEFRAGVARAGRPSAPSGFRLVPHARVVARRGNDWYSGAIHELDEDGDGAYVEFRADGLREHVKKEDVVPEPPAAPPARGDFVLVRPESPSQAWQAVRVLAAGDNEFKVVDESGEERVVPLRDLLPLSAPG